MSLQNHPGEIEFPVRSRRAYARAVEQRRRADPRLNGRRSLLLVACAAPLGLLAIAYVYLALPNLAVDFSVVFVLFAAGTLVGLVIASLVARQVDAAAPLRAQLAYRRLAATPDPTLEEQQILALDAVSDFSFRGWNSSLAFLPTWVELPEELRRTHDDGGTGSPWLALPLPVLAEQRAALDQQFRVAGEHDLLLLVADTVHEPPTSKQFAEVLAGDYREQMLSRVAALTGEDELTLMELGEARDGERPLLLLAGDIERAIGAIRYAYSVGYLSAATAWRLLGDVSALAFARYESYAHYWHHVFLAVAFRTDSLDAVQRYRSNYTELLGSTWPAASVPWPGAR